MTLDHFKYLRFESLQRAFFFEFESAEHLLFLLAGFILVCVCVCVFYCSELEATSFHGFYISKSMVVTI